VAIATDIDDGSTKPAYDLPPPSKAGALSVAETKDATTTANGSAGEEMGEKTGWAPRFGWPSESVLNAQSTLDNETWLETKLPDTLYGGKQAWLRADSIIRSGC
jgi:hypothetical protein